jgi:hypothetical protein
MDAEQHASDSNPFTDPLSKIPSQAAGVTGGAPYDPGASPPATANNLVAYTSLPADSFTSRPAPAADCNAAPTGLVAHSALGAATVSQLAPAAGSNGYTVGNSGSSVSIAADLDVSNVAVDVLVGDTP